jgi:hypothetical protein
LAGPLLFERIWERLGIAAVPAELLKERKLEYILGARERSSAIIRRFVLEEEAPRAPLLVERARRDPALRQRSQDRRGALHPVPQ